MDNEVTTPFNIDDWLGNWLNLDVLAWRARRGEAYHVRSGFGGDRRSTDPERLSWDPGPDTSEVAVGEVPAPADRYTWRAVDWVGGMISCLACRQTAPLATGMSPNWASNSALQALICRMCGEGIVHFSPPSHSGWERRWCEKERHPEPCLQ